MSLKYEPSPEPLHIPVLPSGVQRSCPTVINLDFPQSMFCSSTATLVLIWCVFEGEGERGERQRARGRGKEGRERARERERQRARDRGGSFGPNWRGRVAKLRTPRQVLQLDGNPLLQREYLRLIDFWLWLNLELPGRFCNWTGTPCCNASRATLTLSLSLTHTHAHAHTHTHTHKHTHTLG